VFEIFADHGSLGFFHFTPEGGAAWWAIRVASSLDIIGNNVGVFFSAANFAKKSWKIRAHS
jgi:hypothetical protein